MRSAPPASFRSFLVVALGRRPTPPDSASAAVDGALDRIRHAGSDDEYRAGVAAFQRATIEDPPAIFLAWSERARAVSKRFVVTDAQPGRDINMHNCDSGRRQPPPAPVETESMAITIKRIAVRFALLVAVRGPAAAGRLRRHLAPLAATRHPRIGHRRQSERGDAARQRKSAATSSPTPSC